MKIISWNARGLNSQAKQRVLKRKFQKFNPEIMFIQEIKCSSSSMAKINKKIRRNINYLEVESQGREGGLATLWDTRDIQVISAEANKHFIAVKAQIIGGDFNMITTLLEKKGGLRKLNKDMEAFTSFIDDVKLVDILPKSGNFTWNNRRGGEILIASRLDRFLISENIIMDGITVESDILPTTGSDHWPISLTVVVQSTPRNKPFRFEKFWLDHPNFLELVEKWWSEPLEAKGSKMFNLQKKLRIIKEKIKEWNRIVFGDIFKEKTRIEEKLEQIHKDWASGHSNEEYAEQEKILTHQWHDWCRQEETLWKQKSRIQWLKEGEQNTKFFHRSALDYRSANKILEMKNKNGEPLRNHHDISTLLREHFNSIALEPHLDREEAIKELLKAIPKSINSDQNWALCREITLGEVEEAVNSMSNDKAPGPDGFTINFYKACWHIVRQEVWDVVEDSKRSGSILKSINSTFIALIPKIEEANTPEKFRPTALCNVIYKKDKCIMK
eukprot:PITA_01927